MNLPYFIAKRIAFSPDSSMSKVIIRIAIVAVTLSVAVMIASSALIAGFKYEISKKIFEFWGHIHIAESSFSMADDPRPFDIQQSFYPSIDTVRQIQVEQAAHIVGIETGGTEWVNTKGGIRHIQAFALKAGIIRTQTAMEGIILKGVGPDFDWANLRPYLQAGQPIAMNDTAPSRDIVISQQTADRLQVEVGDKFIVHFVRDNAQAKRLFQVSGIYRTGLEEYDRKFALCDIRQTQELLGWTPQQIAGYEVWLDDLRDLDAYNQYLYNDVLPMNLVSATIREKFPAIFDWLQLQDMNEYVILGLMLAVAIINMITALLVLVLERTNMIGILKALGETNGKIRQIFLYHAAVITLNGIFWGNLLGLGFCWLQHQYKFIALNETNYYLSYAPIKIEWWSVLSVNIGTLVVTLLFLLLPSLAVSRIAPVKAIRFQ
jgi:lipoprotein-releasing system permease protein